MSKRIYVGNLPFSSHEDDVRELFEAHGSVTSVALPTDRDPGRPRGVGWVERDAAAAQRVGSVRGRRCYRRVCCRRELLLLR